MRNTISKTLDKSVLLLLSIAVVLLSPVSELGPASETRVQRNFASLRGEQNQTATKSESQTPADPQVKAVLDKMAAAGVSRPTTVADVRKAYLFYPTLSGSPEQIFRIEDRDIPGPAAKANIGVRVYTPNSTRGLATFVFFQGGGLVASNLATNVPPLQSVSSRRQCIVVSV